MQQEIDKFWAFCKERESIRLKKESLSIDSELPITMIGIKNGISKIFTTQE